MPTSRHECLGYHKERKGCCRRAAVVDLRLTSRWGTTNLRVASVRPVARLMLAAIYLIGPVAGAGRRTETCAVGRGCLPGWPLSLKEGISVTRHTGRALLRWL